MTDSLHTPDLETDDSREPILPPVSEMQAEQKGGA